MASQNGHDKVVRLLLADPRVDPSDSDIIKFASKNGHSTVVELLLEDPRVDPSVDYNLSLGLAAQNGHFDVVKLLLSSPLFNPNLIDTFEEALYAASTIKIVELILDYLKKDTCKFTFNYERIISEVGHYKLKQKYGKIIKL